MDVLIVCNNGCSSSILVHRLQKELEEMGISHKHTLNHASFMLMCKPAKTYDIIMLCPQTYHELLMMKAQDMPKTPMYMIPPKLFVSFHVCAMLEDGEDAILQYQLDHKNPVFFPGEEAYMKNRRSKSYRRILKNKNI